jgi:hypothetical protein
MEVEVTREVKRVGVFGGASLDEGSRSMAEDIAARRSPAGSSGVRLGLVVHR